MEILTRRQSINESMWFLWAIPMVSTTKRVFLAVFRSGLWISITISASCSGAMPGGELPCDGIARPLPGWVSIVENGLFVGVSEPEETEQRARSEALLDARKQIVDFLGVKLSGELARRLLYHRTEQRDRTGTAESQSQDLTVLVKTRTVSRNIVRVREDRSFLQCFINRDGGQAWKAYVRVPFDSVAHNRFVEDWVTQVKELVADGLKRQASMNQPSASSTLTVLKQMMSAVSEVGDLVMVSPSTAGDIETLKVGLDRSMENYLSNLDLRATHTRQTRQPGSKARFVPPEVHVLENDTGNPAARIPVTFTFDDTTQILQVVETSGDGRAILDAGRLPSSDEDLVILSTLGHPELWSLFPDLRFPNVRFALNRGRPGIVVHTSLGLPGEVRLKGNPIEEALSEALSMQGLDVSSSRIFTEDPSTNVEDLLGVVRSRDVTAVVWVDADFAAIETMGLGHDAFCYSMSLHVQMFDVASGQSFFATSLPDNDTRDLRGYGFGTDGPKQAILDAIQGRTRSTYPELFSDIAKQLANALK